VHRRLHVHVHLAEVDEDHHQDDGMQRQMIKLETIGLQQHEEKEDIGSASPAKALEVKTTISPHYRSASRMDPHHILPSYSIAYHPSSRLTCMRSLFDRK
jgi:hypothetical protein